MATLVEELPDNKVRLTVEVPQDDLRHAVQHATHDLAESVKIPGFRKGKVPPQVLQARIGRERIFTEAVESHIGGWFVNAAAGTRIRPVAAPDYEYDLPTSEDDEFSFTATVVVQPKPAPADWSQLEVPYAEPEVPEDVVDQELEALRDSVAELAPVEDRPARTGDVLVIDALDENGGGQRDLVVELGSGRLVEETSHFRLVVVVLPVYADAERPPHLALCVADRDHDGAVHAGLTRARADVARRIDLDVAARDRLIARGGGRARVRRGTQTHARRAAQLVERASHVRIARELGIGPGRRVRLLARVVPRRRPLPPRLSRALAGRGRRGAARPRPGQ